MGLAGLTLYSYRSRCSKPMFLVLNSLCFRFSFGEQPLWALVIVLSSGCHSVVERDESLARQQHHYHHLHHPPYSWALSLPSCANTCLLQMIIHITLSLPLAHRRNYKLFFTQKRGGGGRLLDNSAWRKNYANAYGTV